MSDLNKVMLIGNTCNDPEARYLPTGSLVCNLRIAVNRSFRDREGNLNEESEYINLVCFGKLAETVSKYLTKGRKVYAEGRLRNDSWNDKTTGEKRYKTEIVCQDLKFLDRPREISAAVAVEEDSELTVAV